MNNYDIERKLNDKVDKWEFSSMQSKSQQLDNDVSKLERQVSELQSINQNRYYIIERLLNILAENPAFIEQQNEIYSLRNNL